MAYDYHSYGMPLHPYCYSQGLEAGAVSPSANCGSVLNMGRVGHSPSVGVSVNISPVSTVSKTS